MSMNSTIEKLGRRLRIAVAGGGEGAVIGGVHRTAMAFDGHFEIVAGALSSKPEKSRKQGAELGLARIYDDAIAMIRGEQGRADRVDAIAIMTPNDSHFSIADAALDAGFHVICDKPLANTSRDAILLRDKAAAKNLLLAVTYNYSGYPMVRQARHMVTSGELGRIQMVEVRCVQGNLGAGIENSGNIPKSVAWRLNPEQGGQHHLMLDVGTHSHHLAAYVLDRDFTEVFADLGPAVAGRKFDDSAAIVARMDGDVRTSLLVTKAATGSPNVFGIQVYGERGGIAWNQMQPNTLEVMRPGSIELLQRTNEVLGSLACRSIHIPAAHPEGFREAFANVYSDFAEVLAARIAGFKPNPLSLTLPSADIGVAGLMFVEACHESKVKRAWVKIEKSVRISF
jgi:predicted dehydrogenase